jgi:tetratricopeptide (TPR) repeat protein
MRPASLSLAALLAVSVLTVSGLRAQSLPVAQPTSKAISAQELAHQSSDWALVAPHLPDPVTSDAKTLEMEADLLRARRFPDDALDYYGYALKHGGDAATLFKKMGVTELEIGNQIMARGYFQHAVNLRRRDAEAWNNLGAVDFMRQKYGAAVTDYKRAIKLDKRSPVFHSNLGMAYVEEKDPQAAKNEFVIALRLDPELFKHGNSTGTSLHMISTADHANFSFQMARVYAHIGNKPEMLRSLEAASEAGMDVQYEMAGDRDLAPFVHDPRVVEMVKLARAMRASRAARTSVAAAAITPLPPAAQ